MKPTVVKRWTFMGLVALMLLTPGWAAAQTTFERIVVFGTSLSDPGNAFAFIKTMSLPPYDVLDPFLVPSAPYGKGGHHFSNGATWIEQFARPQGLAGNARPAFLGPGTEATNYAVGGARAREDGINILSVQVGQFLVDFGGVAPSDALYVVEMGANDVRDALAAFATGGDSGAIINGALSGIGNNMGALYAAGARKFLVWNAPNIRLTPAVRILDGQFPGAGLAAEGLTQSFNAGLDGLLGSLAGLDGIEIVRLDVYQRLNDVVADPGAFGLRVVDTACVTPGIPPFECQKPDEFLFWDGIHPTAAVHAIIAQEAALALAQ
jgi:phospholipase/lecithinase/hemolysin